MISPKYISAFAQVGLEDRLHVGGKGASLGELTRAGLAVPPGFVVRTDAFERFLETLERDAPLRAEVEALSSDDLDCITSWSKAVRALWERTPLPQDVLDEVAAAHEALCGKEMETAVAVRSSAIGEDSTEASFAGLQDTFLWVHGAGEVLQKVRTCWASLYSVEAVCYRRDHRLPEQGVAMAVVVQVMVDARTAGVMFTRGPTTGDPSVIAVEGAWGLGSAVVGGEVTPDRWIMSKVTDEILVRQISDKAVQHVPAAGGGIQTVPVAGDLRGTPCLSDEELRMIRSVARQVERHYGRAQDIEWAIDWHTRKIFLLQCRPETVWSRKDTDPVARPATNPLTHVLSIFGGRR